MRTRETRITSLIVLVLTGPLAWAGWLHAQERAGAPAAAQPAAASVDGAAQTPNRLAGETSPYLLLHAHNPVDWYPWGPEALQKARDENKPIFLSIGYSTCYWCHVMEREVFKDEEIAAYMNEHFVNIKVDREERPDIDDQYMLALQLYFQAIGSPQSGGWPTSMFLTPEGKPFAGGTYFPAEDKPGMPGFRTVLEQVHGLWTSREADLRNNADFLASAVKRHSQPGLALEAVELDRSLVQGAVDAILASYDADHGGFGFNPDAPIGPKFPAPPTLMLLALQINEANWLRWQYSSGPGREPERAEQRAAHNALYHALDHTLSRMAMGGIRDHLGGGFHRYSVDREWRIPHFEKMLYDQAQLVETYALLADSTRNFEERPPSGRAAARQVVDETLDFVLRELMSPEGALYSALDAETDGIEGEHYAWSRDEIDAVLGEDDARVFAATYGLNEESRFEHGFVLFLPHPLEETAKSLGMPASELEPRLATMRAKLLAARQQRPALLRDEKILTSWNGLMIRALSLASIANQSSEYAAAAERAARFILTHVRDGDGRLLHAYTAGKATVTPFLDDYAYLISGLLMLHNALEQKAVVDETDSTEEWLHAARLLMDQQIEMFWDERGHGFFYTADEHEPLLARMKDANDSVLPSANAVSVQNLLSLAAHFGNDDYRQRAEQTLRVFAPALKQSPASLPTMAAALDTYLDSLGLPSAGNAAQRAAAPQTALKPQQDDDLVPAAEPSPEDARKHDKLSATAYFSMNKVPAGGECQVAVVLDVQDGWHINANPARPDFLIPTELTAKLPAEFALADVKYPPGMAFEQQGMDEPLLVYEGRVVLYAKLKAPASAAGTSQPFELAVRYQTCNAQTCLRPARLVLKGELSVAARGEQPRSVNQSLFKRVRAPSR